MFAVVMSSGKVVHGVLNSVYLEKTVSWSLRAKRSNPAIFQPFFLDCLVAALLAMTLNRHYLSTPAKRESLTEFKNFDTLSLAVKATKYHPKSFLN